MLQQIMRFLAPTTRQRCPLPLRSRGLCAGIVGCCLSLAGCTTRTGTMSMDEANNALRADNARLTADNAALRAQLAELTQHVERAGGSVAGFGLDAGEVARATPVVTTIEIDRLSGVRTTTGPNAANMHVATVYIRTLDGQGRFTQVVGSLEVVVLEGERIIASRVLSPLEVRDSYRSGFAGTHYVVELAVPAGSAPTLLRATLTDAASGRTLVGEKQ